MAKDYAKSASKRSRSQQKPRPRWRNGLMVAVVFGLVSASVTGVFFYNQNHATHLLTQLVALTQPKKTSMVVAPKLAVNKATQHEAPPVQFDFYDALPKMQMPPQTSLAEQNVPQLKPVAASPKPAVSKPTIFNAADVSDMLATEKTPISTVIAPAYHLQLGTFDTESAARLLVDAVNSIGFQARVVKIRHEGHNIYHVQQGPFANMELAKASQLRLQKRGIISTLRRG